MAHKIDLMFLTVAAAALPASLETVRSCCPTDTTSGVQFDQGLTDNLREGYIVLRAGAIADATLEDLRDSGVLLDYTCFTLPASLSNTRVHMLFATIPVDRMEECVAVLEHHPSLLDVGQTDHCEDGYVILKNDESGVEALKLLATNDAFLDYTVSTLRMEVKA